MLDIATLQKEIRSRLGGEITLREKGKNSFFILSPFEYDDGDTFRIILNRKNDVWELTDEGHTLMFLSYYDINMDAPTRQNILERALSYHGARLEEGRISIDAENERDLAGAFYDIVQTISKVSDISMWTRERAKSLFMEEFRQAIVEMTPSYEREFDYYRTDVDPGRLYKIDCRIRVSDKKDVFVFAVNSENKGKETVITILSLEKNKIIMPTVVIYENQEEIGKKTISKISDAADKSFSSLGSAKERFSDYITEKVI